MNVLDFSKIELNKKIKFGLGFSIFVLLISSVLSFYSIRKLIEQSNWVNHTNQVLLNLNDIPLRLRVAESNQRGYLITGNKSFLNSYNEARRRIYMPFDRVKELTADNQLQQQYLDSLKPVVDQRMRRLEEVIAAYSVRDTIPYAYMQEGQVLMDECIRIITVMKEEESRLLAIREAETQRFSEISPVIIALSSLFALLISSVALYFITKDIAHKERIQRELDRNNYLLTGTSHVNDLLRGEKNLNAAGAKILKFLCEFMKARAGVFYQEDHGTYNLTNQYAFDMDNDVPLSFREGQGLIGQVVAERAVKLIDNVPAGSLHIKSGLASIDTVNILIVPFHYSNQTIAVMELMSPAPFNALDLEFIDSIGNTISVFMNSIRAETRTLELLAETQNQAEELEAQQEELRQINDEMREQRDRLQTSEEELRASEEELQEKNAELEEKTNELEEQYEAIRAKNVLLEDAKEAVQIKMDQVETISRYKSDFLANMSHELRTPLNSILILARILKDSKSETLTDKERQHASVIERSGNDLLKLINEILDLARIESGKIKLELADISVKEFTMEDQFKDQAKEKQITFTAKVDKHVPAFIHTDKFRLEQVLKNLLSNAFKFTEPGGRIDHTIHIPKEPVLYTNKNLHGTDVVAFSVKDTGIGIPDEKKHMIFEAFQQADLSTTRKYGGSGLGLTISRDLANLLGGEIQFESAAGQGSTFTLYVPITLTPTELTTATPEPEEIPAAVTRKPEKNQIEQMIPAKTEKKNNQSSSILIIEDDFYFCNILADYAQKKGYEVYTANTGKEGFELAKLRKPDAILLDIKLPDANGWDILKKIKSDVSLKKTPVHLMSAYDMEGTNDFGQANFIAKPVTMEALDNALGKIKSLDESTTKKVLIVEDNANENNAVKELLFTQEVESDSAFSGSEALQMLVQDTYDCIILDINLPDLNGYQVLEEIQKNPRLKTIPVIIYSGKDLSEKEEAALKKYVNTIIIKTEYSYTRLLEEVKLFLYSMDQSLKKTETLIKNLHKSEVILTGKKVLIADDDMRNIYSLTTILEEHGMNVIAAYNGNEALAELDANPDTDIILMDIMMPEMDGIEATRAIRSKNRKGSQIPIIAVTAKAMPGDKENCLAAGVSDYISKPIDVNKLLSLMRVWLYEEK